jgi:two-component system OmpR family response regulator
VSAATSEKKIILIIDDKPVSDGMRQYFADYDTDIKTISPQNILLENIEALAPSCVLLAWNNCSSSEKICQQLFNRISAPLIATNRVNDDELCISALSAGADDYLLSPINPRELHARIKAIRRRVTPASIKPAKNDKIKFHNWQLDTASRQLFSPNKIEVKLSTGEFNLLLAFTRNAQRILSRDELLEMTKSRSMEPFERSIDVQISRLRHKIEKDPRKPDFIKTVRCGGYLFTPQVTMQA